MGQWCCEWDPEIELVRHGDVETSIAETTRLFTRHIEDGGPAVSRPVELVRLSAA